jgi:hypothetical protein
MSEEIAIPETKPLVLDGLACQFATEVTLGLAPVQKPRILLVAIFKLIKKAPLFARLMR